MWQHFWDWTDWWYLVSYCTKYDNLHCIGALI